MMSMAARAAAHATGLPEYVPPMPPGCTLDITSARPVTPGEGQAAGYALGRGDQVGHHSLVVAGEPVAGPAEARLHLVGDEQHAVLGAPRGQIAGRNPGAGTTKPPFPLDRLDEHAGHVAGADLLVDHVDRPLRGILSASCRSGSRNG